MSRRESSSSAGSWWAKLLLAVAFPLLFFLLIEGGLRLGGFGVDTNYFIPDETPGVYRTNPRFTEQFFPASFGLKPVNFRLTKEKAPGTRRIFVIGESAAMGVPEPAFSLAPQLQAQLRAADPAGKIEVFNLGITAINSHAIRRIVAQAVEFQPDVLVIYMGNNEVVGPFGPGSILSGGVPSRWLIRTGLWVRSTRTGQLVQRMVAALSRKGSGFKDWRGMEMFARNIVGPDDPRLAQVRANFAANLADMLADARDAGAKVVLSTVAVNVRDCAPFVSQHTPGLTAAQLEEWQGYTAKASRAIDLGQPDAARQNLERALALDPGYADTHFQLARTLEAAGDLPAARARYLRALQLDGLRFRADAALNDLIRQAAARAPETVTLVDAARELGADAASVAPPAGVGLFFEHVHLRWEGNYALARLLVPAVWSALPGKGSSSPAWLDRAACADAVCYSEFGHLAMAQGMAVLTERPPFTGQSSYAEDRTRLLKEVGAIQAALKSPEAVAAARWNIGVALAHDPQNPWLHFQAAAVWLQSGELKNALDFNDRVDAVLPASPETAVQRAFILQKLGRNDEAEALLLRTAESAPYYFQTYGLLAQLWLATNRADKARDYFAGLVEWMPDSRGARSTYGQLLAYHGDWMAAEQQWRAVLNLVPDDESALAPLLKHLEQAGRAGEAEQLMRAAYDYNPRNFRNNTRLVQWAETKGDTEQLVRYLQSLAASGPVNALLYVDLATQLAKLGRREEVPVALARARRIAEAEGDSATLRRVEEMMQPRGN